MPITWISVRVPVEGYRKTEGLRLCSPGSLGTRRRNQKAGGPKWTFTSAEDKSSFWQVPSDGTCFRRTRTPEVKPKAVALASLRRDRVQRARKGFHFLTQKKKIPPILNGREFFFVNLFQHPTSFSKLSAFVVNLLSPL